MFWQRYFFTLLFTHKLPSKSCQQLFFYWLWVMHWNWIKKRLNPSIFFLLFQNSYIYTVRSHKETNKKKLFFKFLLIKGKKVKNFIRRKTNYYIRNKKNHSLHWKLVTFLRLKRVYKRIIRKKKKHKKRHFVET